MPKPNENTEIDLPAIDPMDFLRPSTEPVIDPKGGEPKPKPDKKDPPLADDGDGKKGAAELRRDRDRLKAENDKLQAEIAAIKGLEKLKPLSKVAEYLETKEGKLDDEVVDKYITRNKERKTKLTTTEQEIATREEKIKELSLVESREWQEDYLKPISKARESFLATIGEADKDGKLKNAPLIQTLALNLVRVKEDGSYPTGIEIKGILKAFAEDYEKKTGEEYVIPRINDVVNEVTGLLDNVKKAEEAKKNWEVVKTQKQKEKEFENAKKQETLTKQEIKGRQYLYSQAVEAVDEKELDGIIPVDDFKQTLQEEHNNFTSILLGKPEAKKRNYQELLIAMAKGSKFDTLLQSYKELQKEFKEFKASKNDGLPPGGGRGGNNPPPKVNTDKVNKPGLDFLS